MSPHAGEDPLSLAFALTFAVLGALIAIYITWRVGAELLEKRRVAANEPIAAARHANVYRMATMRAMIVVKTPRGSDAFRALRYSCLT